MKQQFLGNLNMISTNKDNIDKSNESFIKSEMYKWFVVHFYQNHGGFDKVYNIIDSLVDHNNYLNLYKKKPYGVFKLFKRYEEINDELVSLFDENYVHNEINDNLAVDVEIHYSEIVDLGQVDKIFEISIYNYLFWD